MCAIFGSFNSDKFNELYDLNSYRGSITNSKALFQGNKLISLERSSDPFEKTNYGNYLYCLGHSQAPTGQFSDIHPAELKLADENRVHPISRCLLWHNGLIKDHAIKYLKEKYKITDTWDTSILNILIYELGSQVLSDIDGSFACVFYDAHYNKLNIFRNEICPLFIDDDLNLSSTKFENSSQIDPNVFYDLDLYNKTLTKTNKTFTTKNNPYFII